MFDRLKAIFRKGAVNIIGSNDLFEALNIEVPVSKKMQDAIKLWSAIHENRAPWLCDDIVSMNLAATIAADLARLVATEMKSELSGGARAEYLKSVYDSFLKDKKVFTEFACARGDIVFKPYIDGNKLAIDQVKAGEHYSLAFDSNRKSTSELFLDWHIADEKMYVRGEVQTLTGTTLEITNKAVWTDTKNISYRPIDLSRVEKWANLQPYTAIENVEQPPWGCFKMPSANKIDPSSPLGISVYAMAVSLIEHGDRVFSNLLHESDFGRMKLYIDETVTQRDGRGNLKPVEDAFTVDAGEDGFFKEFAPILRDQSIINIKNEVVCVVEDTCGLSRGTLSRDPSVEARTATEINFLKQNTYLTADDIQDALADALEGLVYGLDMWATVGTAEGYLTAPRGTTTVSTVFGDSIRTNQEEEYTKRFQATASGLLKGEYTVAHLLNLPTETEEDLAEVRKYMPDMGNTRDFEEEQ